MAAETAHTAPVTAGETLPPAAAASGVQCTCDADLVLPHTPHLPEHLAQLDAETERRAAAAASGAGDVDVAAIRTLVAAWEAHPSNLAAYEIAKRGRALLAEVERLRAALAAEQASHNTTRTQLAERDTQDIVVAALAYVHADPDRDDVEQHWHELQEAVKHFEAVARKEADRG